MTITTMARQMLVERRIGDELIRTGQEVLGARYHDEEAITWEHIVARLRTVLAAR